MRLRNRRDSPARATSMPLYSLLCAFTAWGVAGLGSGNSSGVRRSNVCLSAQGGTLSKKYIPCRCSLSPSCTEHSSCPLQQLIAYWPLQQILLFLKNPLFNIVLLHCNRVLESVNGITNFHGSPTCVYFVCRNTLYLSACLSECLFPLSSPATPHAVADTSVITTGLWRVIRWLVSHKSSD